jgi:hypothetical protein
VDNYVYHFSSNWSDDWFYRDGYFYYTHPLPTETSTSTLLEGITETSSNGATVDVPVTVDAIQANPTSFVEDAWGVTVTDGELS